VHLLQFADEQLGGRIREHETSRQFAPQRGDVDETPA
jgi:hypothetical protein